VAPLASLKKEKILFMSIKIEKTGYRTRKIVLDPKNHLAKKV